MISHCRIFMLSLVCVMPLVFPPSSGAQVLPNDSTDIAIYPDPSVTTAENSVFIDPLDSNRVLTAHNTTGPFERHPGFFVSTDGGLTWTGNPDLPADGFGDPTTAISRSGRFSVGYNSGNPVDFDITQGVGYLNGAGVMDFSNEEFTEIPVADPPEPLPGQLHTYTDKPHLWVDNSPSVPQGRLYNAWQDIFLITGRPDARAAIEFKYSEDGGASWQSNNPPTRTYISQGGWDPSDNNLGVNLQTAPNGNVYAVWAIVPAGPISGSSYAIGFNRWCRAVGPGCDAVSDEWAGAEIIINDIHGSPGSLFTLKEKVMMATNFPSMTVGPDGSIYVVWANIGEPENYVEGDDPDIYMIKSSDGGEQWSVQPIRVNQDPIGSDADQWLPWIAADPSNGDLVCIFHDSRAEVAIAETFVALSRDGGDTWADFKISDEGWTPDSRVSDYIGIDIQDGMVYPVWSDRRVPDGPIHAYVSPFQVVSKEFDSDDDFVEDSVDNCPDEYNPYQEDTDGDLYGDVCDNCSDYPNPEQADANFDGYGNQCDADYDDDGWVGFGDFGLFQAACLPDTEFQPFLDLILDDCSGIGDLGRFGMLFDKAPGPSGLACQGATPSGTGFPCRSRIDDDDGDGLANGVDNCPNDWNTTQLDVCGGS